MESEIDTGGSFWPRWMAAIEEKSDTYIRPSHPQVTRLADEIRPAKTRYETAKDVWKTIHNRTEYKQSNRWKTPNQTIKTNTGDCDDQTFLQTSVLAALGIPTSICGGTLTFPNGTTEEHVWNTVDGRIVDATATPYETSHLTYTTYARVDIIPQ